MSIKKRLDSLEQKQPSTDKRYYVATPDLDDDMILYVQEVGKPERTAMTLNEYAHWLTLQPHDVVYRLAYPDSDSSENRVCTIP